jgi:glutamate/tyrosine decarboxylase-like PLP-dependent enzyme
VPPWDFRVDGVDSISADLHKLGYAPKGVSVIVHRTKELRRLQTWTFDRWLGGMYGSPNLQGSRSGLPMAAAWAVMQHLGIDGYVSLTRQTLEAADRMRAEVATVDGLRVLGEPLYHLFAVSADGGAIDVFALGDAMARRGWYHDRQAPPDSLHSTVSAGNAKAVDAWIRDLAASVEEVRGTRSADRSTKYSTVD